MQNAEMKVTRFSNEDVIATSANWSIESYIATSTWRVAYPLYSSGITTNYSGTGKSTIDGTNYNYLNSQGSTKANGEILTEGNFYHYDLDSMINTGVSYNWKICDDTCNSGQNHRHTN